MSAFELGATANQVDGPAKKIMARVRSFAQQHPATRVVSVPKNDYAELLAAVNRVLERQARPATNATHLGYQRLHIKAGA
ncbi:MAG: hypothetical protein RPR40_07960 [Bermanella sp.]